MQNSASNPCTFSQETMRLQLVDPLLERKGYLIQRAKAVERSDNRWGSVLSKWLHKVIPDKGKKGGIKQNASKAILVGVVAKSWTAIRKIYEHPEGKFSREASHALEQFIFVMSHLESECIAAVLHESNTNVNSESLPLPKAEKDVGFDPKLVPSEARLRNCARCKLKTVNYPSNHKEVKKARAEVKQEYLRTCKQFEDSKKDASIQPPLNSKGNPLTKPPNPPQLQPLHLICKGFKMNHHHGRGQYKCPNCTDRSCSLCKNKCMFVCTTE